MCRSGEEMKRICPKANNCKSVCTHKVEHEENLHCNATSGNCKACLELKEYVSFYGEDGDALFDAMERVCNFLPLISECQDFINILKEHGFELRKIEK